MIKTYFRCLTPFSPCTGVPSFGLFPPITVCMMYLEILQIEVNALNKQAH